MNTARGFHLSLSVFLVAVFLDGLPAQEGARTGSITGRVVDALGGPVPAVEVVVRSLSTSEKVLAKTRTDGDGMFVLSRLPPVGWMRVEVTAPGCIRANTSVRTTEDGASSLAILRLWEAATVRGRAVDEAGDPVMGVEVVAAFDASRLFGFEPVAVATTNKAGVFVLEKVPLGLIDFRGFVDGYTMASQRAYIEGDSRVGLEMVKQGGTSIALVVHGLDAADRRRAHVQVLPYDRTGSVQALPSRLMVGALDAKGRWSARGMPDSDYQVAVTLDGYTFDPRDVEAVRGDGPHRLEFRARRRTANLLRGTLLLPDGKPLAHEVVIGRGLGYPLVSSRAVTDKDGAFILESPVAPGRKFSLELAAGPWVIAGPRMHTADSRSRFELRVIPEIRISGRVTDARGNHARFVRVRLERRKNSGGWSHLRSTRTNRQGQFTFGGLQKVDADARVRVAGAAGAGASKPFRVELGVEGQEIEVAVAAPGIVAGVIRDGDGKAIPGARVQLRNWDLKKDRQSDGGVVEVLTDRQGRFRLLGVAPGGHYFDVHVAGLAYSGRQNDIFQVDRGAVVRREVTVSR